MTTNRTRSQGALAFLLSPLAVVLTVLVLVPSPTRAQPAPTGRIAGQINNALTGDNLAGVRVQVVDSNFKTTTARDGTYELTGLPAGRYTVTFEYPGLDPQTATLSVSPGETTRQDIAFTSEIYVLPEFAVSGEREGNAAAIVQQRDAVNLQNVVTADAFGNIAKGNVGNFLKRIPGIAGTTDEVDTENIILRGMAANFTSLDIDGTRSAGGSPDGRNQSAAAIQTDMIERVEVIKAPTPDIDADSLGGRVNLVTKSAFDRTGRRISLRAASSYSFTYGSDVGRRNGDAFAPSVSASYSDTLSIGSGTRNLGVIANANFERILDVRGTTAWNWTNPLASGLDYPEFNNVSVALHEQVRGGASLRFDYKASDDLRLQVSGGFNTFENNMFRTRNQFQSGNIREALSTDPFFVVIDNARYRAIRETRDQATDKAFAKFNARYRGPAGFRADFDLSYEKAKRKEYRTSFNPRSRLRMSYVLDRRDGFADARWPSIRVFRAPTSTSSVTTTTTPTTFLDVNPFGVDDFSNVDQSTTFWRRHFTDNEIFGAKLDLTKKFESRWPVEVKAGVRYRNEITKANRDEINGSLVGTNLSGYLDDTWDLGGAIGRYPVGFVPSTDKVQQAAQFNFVGGDDPLTAWTYDPAVFSPNVGNTLGNSLLSDRKIWEDLYATYAQARVEAGRLEVLGGVRVEHTELDRSIPVRDRTYSSTNILSYIGRARDQKSYTNVFPSLHFRYEFSPRLIAHASYSTTIGRPNFGNIISSADIDPSDLSISVPNLELKPQESQNYDLSLEYYFEPVGVFSVGFFQKDLEKYHVSRSFDISEAEARDLYGAPDVDPSDPNETWEVSTRINGGSGTVQGIEFNYSQQLSFLPGAWRGFGVFANFTYLEAEGTFDSGGTTKISQLSNFVPRTANAGVTYAYGRYDFRFQWNYTDSFIESLSLSDPYHRNKWRGQRWQMDFSAKYQVTPKITVFADLINLSSEYGKKYRGYVDPVRREETNALGFLLTAGLLATF